MMILNGINNISFGRADKGIKTPEEKKKNHKRAVKIAVAAGAVGLAAGGVMLYKNRNSKPVLKFRDFVKNGILAPLKEKDVPVKKKVSNVWNNLKTGVQNLGNKPNKGKAEAFVDTIEINNKADNAGINKQAAQSVKKPAEKLQKKPVNDTKLQDNQTKSVQQPAKKSASASVSKPAVSKKEGQKSEKARKIGANKPSKTSDKVKGLPPVAAGEIPPQSGGMVDDIKGGESKGIGGSIMAAAKNHARDLKVAAGTAAVVTGGAVAGAKINDAAGKDNEKKNYSITVNGKEFKGRLENGKAFNENGEPLNGTIDVVYDSGKRVAITYNSGYLAASTVFDNADDKIPSAMRVYNDGKISKKYNELKPNPEKGENAFKSDDVQVFDSDSMLKSKTRILDGEGKHTAVDYYLKNTGKDGKIAGKPIFVSTNEAQKFDDGTSVNNVSIPYGGEDVKLRTIKKEKDGSMEITLFSPKNGREIAQLLTDADKKVNSYWHFSNGKGDDSAFEIQDGKLVTDDFTGGVLNADLMPDSTDSIKRYKTDDGTIIEIGINQDKNIQSITEYSNKAKQAPEFEMLFKDGRAASEIFYDEDAGNVIFKLNHKL